MHWGPEYVGGRAGGEGVNALTSQAVDPDSFQPELKHAAVRIEPARPAAEAVAFGWLPAERALAMTRDLLAGRVADGPAGGLLVALRIKGETAGELAAAATALDRSRSWSLPIASGITSGWLSR